MRSFFASVAAAVLAFVAVRALLPERVHQPALTIPLVASPSSTEPNVERELLSMPAAVEPSNETAEAGSVGTDNPSTSSLEKDAAAPRTAPTPAGNRPETLVHGMISDEEGQALKGVLVLTHTPDGRETHTETDADGRYALGPLAQGDWSITLYQEGRRSRDLEVRVDGKTELLRRDVVLKREQIVRILVVTSEGSSAVPLLREEGLIRSEADLAAVATRERPENMIGVDRSELWESFGVGAPLQGRAPRTTRDESEFVSLAIQVRGTTWVSLVSNNYVLESRQVDEGVEELRFVLDPGDLLALRSEVQATLVDTESGAPVAAKVLVGNRRWFMDTHATPNESETGHITLSDLAPGHKWWMARADGYADVKLEIVIPANGSLDLGTVRFKRPVSLTGSVLNGEGQPLEAVLGLSVLDPSTDAVTPVKGVRYKSGPDGQFAIHGLEPAHYLLQARGTPAAPPRAFDPHLRSLPVRIDARSGSKESISLTTESTTRITFPTGKLEEPWPYLEALGEDGTPVDTSWLGRWFGEAWIDVPQGDYTLRIRRRDGSHFDRPLTVGNHPARLEFTEGLDSADPAVIGTPPR